VSRAKVLLRVVIGAAFIAVAVWAGGDAIGSRIFGWGVVAGAVTGLVLLAARTRRVLQAEDTAQALRDAEEAPAPEPLQYQPQPAGPATAGTTDSSTGVPAQQWPATHPGAA
jgi:hypothetical protein